MALEEFKEYANGNTHSSNIERDFKEACEEHSEFHTTGDVGLINLFLVHPFFDEIENGNVNENIERLEDILKILPENIKRILVETNRHYVRKTHKMVEQGIFDNVFFTFSHNGLIIKEDSLKVFSNSVMNYFAGCYEYNCVGETMDQLNKTVSTNRIRIVKDCCVNNRGDTGHKYLETTHSNLLLLR